MDLAHGYLKGKLGKEMMYIDKPNHIGIEVGKVISYNPNKGHVKMKLSKELDLGDSIAIGNSSCKVSELMIENNNIKSGQKGQIVVVGRIKGKIYKDDKVYKTVSDKLNREIVQISSRENIKRPVNCKIYLRENEKLRIEIEDIWSKTWIIKEEDIVVTKAENTGLTIDRIIQQLSKTGNTPFEIKDIDIQMDKKVIVPISSLNSIRRNTLEELKITIINSFRRNRKIDVDVVSNNSRSYGSPCKEVSILLNTIKEDINYLNLKGIDSIYIPFKLLLSNKERVEKICNEFNTYIYLPAITKGNYEKLINNNLKEILKEHNIKGIVISNPSHLKLLERFKEELNGLNIVANYTLNISNDFTIKTLESLGIEKYTVSPEADKEEIHNLGNDISKEIIVYGRTLLMTTEYCLIGPFKNCTAPCEKGTYKLKDRMGFEFPIYTDRINCNNLIYNSKVTSISWKDLNTDSIRIDILEETEEEIQNIINVHKRGDRLEGEDYTNGNLNREI